jgi:hypothetical protein
MMQRNNELMQQLLLMIANAPAPGPWSFERDGEEACQVYFMRADGLVEGPPLPNQSSHLEYEFIRLSLTAKGHDWLDKLSSK